MEKYSVDEKIIKESTVHCACLAIVKNNRLEIDSFEKDLNTMPNGTITFVEKDNKIYGITCKHVLDVYLKSFEQDSNYTLCVVVNGIHEIINNFYQPINNFDPTNGELDIVISEIDRDIFEKFSKEAINVDFDIEMNSKLELGIFVGFPEKSKYVKKIDNNNAVISMPNVAFVAEYDYDYFPEQRFILNSNIDKESEYDDYSGMSGGPVFWNDDDKYGIFGIGYEAGNSFGCKNNITVFCHLATNTVIRDWIEQIN